MSERDSGKTMGAFSYKQVNKENIPQIISFISSKTDNFKIPLKQNGLGKTETFFGEIDTKNIIESINENNEIYYVFSIIPEVSDAQTYNLEIKFDGTIPESAKIVVYYPTEDWQLNGNGDFSVFSGRAYTYSLDGNLETSVDYDRGTAGTCDPNPCPDCPINPNGGGTGGGGGGYPPGQGPGTGNPPTGGGGMPTQCVGCNPTVYPPYSPSTPSPGTAGTTSGGLSCHWECEYEGTQCIKMVCVTTVFTPRLINPCGGGGVVVYIPSVYLNNTLTAISRLYELNLAEMSFLNNNSTIASNLASYIRNNNNQQGAVFVKWAVGFLMQSTNTTWGQFESWFITKTEGQDGEYIINLDDIHNMINYQTSQMPTYSQFITAFPKLDYSGYPGYFKQMPASQVYPIVGDPLSSLYISTGGDNGKYKNACTVRWSLAMNRLGILIPQNSLSLQGANVNGQNRYYYIRASTAGDAMHKIFGSPTHKLEGPAANNSQTVINFLKGKTGIYVIVNANSGAAGYTGHVDLIQNGHIPGGSNHENVSGGIKYIGIWEFTP